MYLTYKEGTLTVYIDHASDDPNNHYIETVSVMVNRVETLKETYTTQKADDAKGMVTYSYAVTATDGDVITVTAECSIDGSIMETLTVGSTDNKDDGKDYPDKNNTKDYPDKDGYNKDDPFRKDPTDSGDSDQKGDSNDENGTILILSGAIVGVLVIIIALLVVLRDKKKRPARNESPKKDNTKKDDWTSCPKCGSSIRMGKLNAHLDTVHPKLSTKARERIIDDVKKLH
jgi:hypothetical protein